MQASYTYRRTRIRYRNCLSICPSSLFVVLQQLNSVSDVFREKAFATLRHWKVLKNCYLKKTSYPFEFWTAGGLLSRNLSTSQKRITGNLKVPTLLIIATRLIIPPATTVAGGIMFYCWSFFLFLSFFFFSFATGSPRWLYRQGTFLAQIVGYGCNFKNWVQNLGATPIKIWGPKPPILWTKVGGRGLNLFWE